MLLVAGPTSHVLPQAILERLDKDTCDIVSKTDTTSMLLRFLPMKRDASREQVRATRVPEAVSFSLSTRQPAQDAWCLCLAACCFARMRDLPSNIVLSLVVWMLWSLERAPACLRLANIYRPCFVLFTPTRRVAVAEQHATGHESKRGFADIFSAVGMGEFDRWRVL